MFVDFASVGQAHARHRFEAQQDLASTNQLFEAGDLAPVVDRRCTLSDVADAFRRLSPQITKVKVVVNIPPLT